MKYQDLNNLARDTELHNRLQFAVKVAALGVFVEGTETENHVGRLIWANEAFDSEDKIVREMAWAVVADQGIQTKGDTVLDGKSGSALINDKAGEIDPATNEVVKLPASRVWLNEITDAELQTIVDAQINTIWQRYGAKAG